MRVWRICRKRYAASAFSGEGARLYSGRWNDAGVAMVYTSLSLSLAAMETFVHLDPTVAPNDLVSVCAEWAASEAETEQLKAKELPKNWKRMDHPVLRKMGSDWVRSGRSLALLVPSAVVDGEWNVLINPSHPDAQKIHVDSSRNFHFDERMFRLKR